MFAVGGDLPGTGNKRCPYACTGVAGRGPALMPWYHRAYETTRFPAFCPRAGAFRFVPAEEKAGFSCRRLSAMAHQRRAGSRKIQWRSFPFIPIRHDTLQYPFPLESPLENACVSQVPFIFHHRRSGESIK